MTTTTWQGGKILYALVAKKTFVLAEYEVSISNPPKNSSSSMIYGIEDDHLTSQNYSSREDFPSIARKVMGRIPRTQGLHSYLYETYMFTYFVQNDLLLMCISHTVLGHDIPSCFLEELLRRPELRKTGEAAVLTRVLRDMLEPPKGEAQQLFGTAARLSEAEEKLDSVTEVVKDNIKKVINRSQHIDSLMSRASDLSHDAFTFRDSSRKLHRQLWCQSIKRPLILSIVAVFFCLLLSILFFCGPPWDVSDVAICRKAWGQS